MSLLLLLIWSAESEHSHPACNFFSHNVFSLVLNQSGRMIFQHWLWVDIACRCSPSYHYCWFSTALEWLLLTDNMAIDNFWARKYSCRHVQSHGCGYTVYIPCFLFALFFTCIMWCFGRYRRPWYNRKIISCSEEGLSRATGLYSLSHLWQICMKASLNYSAGP